MTYHFACGDVVAGCPRTFEQPSREAMLAAVATHAHDDHGVTELSDELVTAVNDAMRVTG